MSNIQSILTIGAIVLFSLICLRFNTTVLQTVSIEVENKIYLTAFSLGDTMLEEIKQKAFDEQTVVFRSINPDELTEYNLFGPDAGESTINDFDDIDDYHNYNKVVSMPHFEGYEIDCQVSYAREDNYEISLTQTFYKRVDVEVTNVYLQHSVKLHFIFTLHSK